MIAKPGQEPLIGNEREVVLKEAIEYIDKQLYRDRGEKAHRINIERVASSLPAGTWMGWLYQELARLYASEGEWKYVTVYEKYSIGSTSGCNTYLYISNEEKLEAREVLEYPGGWNIRYVAGAPIRHELTQRQFDALILSAKIVGIIVLLVAMAFVAIVLPLWALKEALGG